MKNNKIIATSIASMMLIAGMAMPKVSAAGSAEIRYAKNSGYLTSDSSAIVVGLTNGDKDLTKDELSQLVKEKYGLTVAEVTGTVKTGTKIRLTTGESATLVVYGDVEADGKIDYNDVQKAFDITRGTKSVANGSAEFRATDIEAETSGSAVIDYNDVQRLFDHVRDVRTDLTVHTSKLPEDVQEKYEINMTVNQNGYINNSNKTGSNFKATVNFGIPNPLDKDSNDTSDNKGYYVEVLNSKGEKVKVGSASGSISAEKANVVVHKNLVKDSADIYLENTLPDGVYTVVLRDKDGNVVSTTTTEIRTNTPKAILVSASRPSSSTGTLSLTAVDSGAVKAYYVVVENTDAATYTSKDPADLIKLAKGEMADSDAGIVSKGTATLTNNTLTDYTVSTELTSDKAYKVVFVLESVAGNVSTTTESTDILVDDELTAEPSVDKTTIKVPNLKETTAAAAKFTWTAPEGMTSSAHYEVVIYKDGEIIDEVECTTAEFECKDSDLLDLSKPGTYKISVRVKGNGTTKKDSAPVESEEIVVTALSPVEDINLESATKLTWKDTVNGKNVNNYAITIKQLTGTAKGSTIAVGTPDVAKKEVSITETIVSNEIYEVTIVAKADATQAAIVDSEETVKKCFIIGVGSFTVTSTTDHTATLKANKIVIDGVEANYEVRVYTINTIDPQENGTYKQVTSGAITTSISKDDNGNLVIVATGLDADTDYAFRLIATANGVQGTSGYETARTAKEAPSVNGKTVVKSKDLATEGTVYAYTSASKQYIVVDGEEYNITDENYPAGFEGLYSLISALNSNDQIVVAEGNTLKLKLGNTARATLDLTTTVKGKNVEIEGAGFETEIKVTAGSEAAEMVLKGNNAQFNVDGLNAETIKLEDNVTIFNTTSRNFEIAKNATINGVKITTGTALNVTVAGKSVEINVSSGTTNNELTIVNEYPANVSTSNDATIRFVGETDNTSVYIGKVTISSTNGGITVCQSQVNVTGINLDIDVTDANVTLTDVAFTGNKDVNVTFTSDASNKEVKVLAETEAPVTITSAFELKTYRDEDGIESLEALRTALTSADVTAASSMTEKELQEVQTFLNSFGINDIGATITTVKNNKAVTIKFTKKVNSVEIKGIE